MARKKNKEEWKVYGNVFDAFTNRILFKLESQGYFTGLTSAYMMGKEANIFLADTKEGGQIIVKIYRLENCNFNKMYEYLCQDERYVNLKGQRRQIIFNWVQREYRNLLKARESIRVPTPIAFKDNILLMELIGEKGEPAPQLKDAIPKDPETFYTKVIENMEALKKEGLVHGDLSAFNILNLDEEPIFIDFSQGTTTSNQQAQSLYERDCKNINTFFKKIGVKEELITKKSTVKQE